MTDERFRLVLQLVTALAVIIGPTIIAILQRRAEMQLIGLKSTADKTHALVNSEHGMALSSLAKALGLVASMDPTEKNIAAAKTATRASSEHQCKQDVLDAKVAEDSVK